MRTQGKVRVDLAETAVIRDEQDGIICSYSFLGGGKFGSLRLPLEQIRDTMTTHATAHNVANQLEAQGIDPIKAFEALPGFLEDTEATSDPHALWVLFDEFMQAIKKEER